MKFTIHKQREDTEYLSFSLQTERISKRIRVTFIPYSCDPDPDSEIIGYIIIEVPDDLEAIKFALLSDLTEAIYGVSLKI